MNKSPAIEIYIPIVNVINVIWLENYVGFKLTKTHRNSTLCWLPRQIS